MADSGGTDPGEPRQQAYSGETPELVKFWRIPVFRLKLRQVPAFLLPRLTEMATEVPSTDLGRRIYYERACCLIVLAQVATDTDLTAVRLTEPPTPAEQLLGRCLGQAFHQGCTLADVALATGLPAAQVIAIGKRTIRRTRWLTKVMAGHPDSAP